MGSSHESVLLFGFVEFLLFHPDPFSECESAAAATVAPFPNCGFFSPTSFTNLNLKFLYLNVFICVTAGLMLSEDLA